MAVRTVTKRKGTRTCSKCKSNLGADEKTCHNCGSSNVKKTLIVVKKTEADGDDAHAPDPPDDENGTEESEDDDSEELSEDDFEPAEEDDDSEDDESEEDDEEEEEKPVTKRIVRRRVAKSETENVDLDIALVGLTVMEDISKAVSEGDTDAYEASMTTFNNVCDEAMESWTNGDSIAKEDKSAKLKRLKSKLAALKAKLGDGGVEKSDDDNEDIFKGLNPKAAAILKNAQTIQEQNTVSKYEGIAKSFGELSASETELGAALRVLDEADHEKFEVVEKTLKAAAEAQKQSAIFKTYGSPQSGSANTGGNLDSIAKSYRDGDNNLSAEQAYSMALRDNPHLYDQALAGN